MQFTDALAELHSNLQRNDTQTSSARNTSLPSSAALADKERDVRTYDFGFTHTAPRQMQSTTSDLIRSRKLSFDESSALVGMIPTALSKARCEGRAPAAFGELMDS